MCKLPSMLYAPQPLFPCIPIGVLKWEHPVALQKAGSFYLGHGTTCYCIVFGPTKETYLVVKRHIWS
jgi:hypothetical protein